MDGEVFAASIVATLKEFRVYSVACDEKPSRSSMRRIDHQLAELSPERLEIFESAGSWTWHWPRRTNAGTTTYETVETLPRTLPTFLAQRLTGLEFTINELKKGITLVDVRDRVQGNFDVSAVTKRFYDRFAKEQVALANAIEGLPSNRRFDYSTTLLNRLMFLYFLQKKEFLNGDVNYLENTLRAVRDIKGNDRYYSFYRDALLPLFFDKLNDRDGHVADPDIRRILGHIPYVNGGIFGRTDIEVEHSDTLLVPDTAFEKIFEFFGAFSWHLDTRPTQNSDEINPEVIGYIFEQFINLASSGKKENGAYYTPHDVTAYMVSQALIPRIFDDFEAIEDAFSLLRADPDRYLQPTMLKGWDADVGMWLPIPSELEDAWAAGPSEWSRLDAAPESSDLNLPGETWVETLHRRDRVELIRSRAAEGGLRSVNDLVTYNLNGQLLLTDAIDRISNPLSVVRLFRRLSELSVFDPTCGSGAFLFAALEVLEDIYAHIVDIAAATGVASQLGDYASQAARPSGKRYFIRKHIAITNLYGTDLMPGAIETAKLRIFLALAACVDSYDDFKPLPDLDFNLKAGNLVVGLKDAADVHRVGNDLVAEAYLQGFDSRIDEHVDLYNRFRHAVQSDSPEQEALKSALRENEELLRPDCDRTYAQVAGIPDADFDDWVESARPFHWFCEFPEIIRRGGFDVVVGNPPYVKRSEIEGYSVAGYKTSTCADLYAPCYERSLSLTHPDGRHAFIVMASLTVWDAFAPLRDVISERGGAEWWSTYGKIPAALFRGVRVRNTIVVLGPGEGRYVTRHHIHTARQRSWLFPTIEYAASTRDGADWPVRGGVATSVLERLRDLAVPTPRRSDDVVYLRPTASYWFPVLLGPAPVLDSDGNVLESVDRRLRVVPLGGDEQVSDVIATLGGRLTYLWWTAISDDFDVYARETTAPRALALAARGSDGWVDAVADVEEAARTVAYVSLNKQWYFNVRWNNVRPTTDKLDRIALQSLGGTEEDWRALHILYRQVMRSSGDSAKGRYVTSDELASLLGW
ncbi:Eco57I restriction-modification methylase domain-containing protein [Agromyces mariniharenae]|uniref:site-specific DNA-methyltransferase (adenine-specific) n=1 Tax=Agromyces mariniharenae TaxID=2604423 RepID=A0A5S4UTX3_9MICO|nr:DNA methyltransferase [Agromyces mariniharenae]TYL50424.1 SAM-dependent DNA methyltransferase [Agromyces mariniharenae]